MFVPQYLTRTFGGGEMSKVSPQTAQKLNLSCYDCAYYGICKLSFLSVGGYVPSTHLRSYGCEQFIPSQNTEKQVRENIYKCIGE